jgi:hypothetical protein
MLATEPVSAIERPADVMRVVASSAAVKPCTGQQTGSVAMRLLVAAAVLMLAAGCGTTVPTLTLTPTPLATLTPTPVPSATATLTPAPSATMLSDQVAVGSEVSCATAAMKRHCDAWVALVAPSLTTGQIASSTVYVGWSTAKVWRSMSVNVVVAFRLSDGSTIYAPVFCGPPQPGDPACDLSDISLPQN